MECFYIFLRYIVHLLKNGNKKDAQKDRTPKPHSYRTPAEYSFWETTLSNHASRLRLRPPFV